jgi:hypothetical protein
MFVQYHSLLRTQGCSPQQTKVTSFCEICRPVATARLLFIEQTDALEYFSYQF